MLPKTFEVLHSDAGSSRSARLVPRPDQQNFVRTETHATQAETEAISWCQLETTMQATMEKNTAYFDTFLLKILA